MFACAITGSVGNEGVVKTNFIYDENRPFEVRVQHAIGNDIVFDRELLSEAFWKHGVAAGYGMVRCMVSGQENFILSFIMQGKIQSIIYPQEEVYAFLKDTFNLVPFGTEEMDFDALLQDFYDDKI